MQENNVIKEIKTNEEKYNDFLSGIRERVKFEEFNETVSIDGDDTLYMNSSEFFPVAQAQIQLLISKYKIPLNYIKENLPIICKDILFAIQDSNDFKDSMEEFKCANKGIISLEKGKRIRLTNEELENPDRLNDIKKVFQIDGSDVFDKVFEPTGGILTLSPKTQVLPFDASDKEIKDLLFILASVNKIHDSRSGNIFSRPVNYGDEEKAIKVAKDKLKLFGFKNKDLDKVLNSKDEDLEETIDNVFTYRFETKKGKIDLNDFSNENIGKLNSKNLKFVLEAEKDNIYGVNGASHSLRLLNAYRAARIKYESAGFFKKYFTSEYRNLKASIDKTEEELTKGVEKKVGIVKLFTKEDLDAFTNRAEPITKEEGVQYLLEHNIETFESQSLEESQKNIVNDSTQVIVEDEKENGLVVDKNEKINENDLNLEKDSIKEV